MITFLGLVLLQALPGITPNSKEVEVIMFLFIFLLWLALNKGQFFDRMWEDL